MNILAQAAAATPSPTPVPAGPTQMVLKDVLTLLIATASFCFAIAAFFRGNFEQRRKLILEQVLEEIHAIEEKSFDLVGQVESILLTTTHSGFTPQKAYVHTQCEFRKAEIFLENLCMVLGAEGDAVHRRYVTWHRALTSDRFPISEIEHAYETSDDRYIRVSIAQAEWRKYLFDLKLKCLRYELKFWKAKK